MAVAVLTIFCLLAATVYTSPTGQTFSCANGPYEYRFDIDIYHPECEENYTEQTKDEDDNNFSIELRTSKPINMNDEHIYYPQSITTHQRKEQKQENTQNKTVYTVHIANATWHEALRNCESSGEHLAVITSQAEQEAVHKEVLALGHVAYSNLWLGAITQNAARQYKWTFSSGDSKVIKDFFNWEKGEPNFYESWGCLYMNKDSGKWFDASCYNRYNYLCQSIKEIPSPTPPSPSSTKVFARYTERAYD